MDAISLFDTENTCEYRSMWIYKYFTQKWKKNASNHLYFGSLKYTSAKQMIHLLYFNAGSTQNSQSIQIIYIMHQLL